MSAIRLIVGLGNIGPEYERTRHNAGFWWVDELARREGGRFAREAKFHGEAARLNLQGVSLWLLKPGTYMNRSGRAVSALANFHRITPAEILVVHDELDLPPGECKLKLGGGAAGHNGLKDIAAALGTQSFWRLRLGIGHPRTLGLQQEVADFVLHPPRREEAAVIDEAIQRSLALAADAVTGRLEAAMMKLHTRPKAAASAGPAPG